MHQLEIIQSLHPTRTWPLTLPVKRKINLGMLSGLTTAGVSHPHGAQHCSSGRMYLLRHKWQEALSMQAVTFPLSANCTLSKQWRNSQPLVQRLLRIFTFLSILHRSALFTSTSALQKADPSLCVKLEIRKRQRNQRGVDLLSKLEAEKQRGRVVSRKHQKPMPKRRATWCKRHAQQLEVPIKI